MVSDSEFFRLFRFFRTGECRMSDYLKIAREVMREQQRSTNEKAQESLEAVLKGQALELWSKSAGEHFWLVADEDDARLLGERRDTVYTAAEAHRVIQIADPKIVAEIHRWKRRFNATLVTKTTSLED